LNTGLQEGLDLPYPFEKVWDAALSILRTADWEVTRQDKTSGGIEVHVTMDMITWTETFYLNLVKTGDNSTRVIVGRIGLAQPVDWGIARQHIEQFLLKLESSLRGANQSSGGRQ